MKKKKAFKEFELTKACLWTDTDFMIWRAIFDSNSYGGSWNRTWIHIWITLLNQHSSWPNLPLPHTGTSLFPNRALIWGPKLLVHLCLHRLYITIYVKIYIYIYICICIYTLDLVMRPKTMKINLNKKENKSWKFLCSSLELEETQKTRKNHRLVQKALWHSHSLIGIGIKENPCEKNLDWFWLLSISVKFRLCSCDFKATSLIKLRVIWWRRVTRNRTKSL